VDTAIDGVVVDKKNNLITSAAYMYEGTPHEIFDSVGNMVREVLAATAK
jgi:enhancing lycopene biosynthesis protein 2